MKVKQFLSVLLCICLLLPVLGMAAPAASAGGEYVIAEIPFKVSGKRTVGGGDFLNNAVKFDPIDLTPYGYPENGTTVSRGKIGLSMDLFISGDEELVSAILGKKNGGQLEITSSGVCDIQEKNNAVGDVVKWAKDSWTRCVIDLADMGWDCPYDGSNKLNPKNINFMRLYMNKLDAYVGQSCTVKICNVRFVNLTVAAPSLTDDPIGDGTFSPEAPDWQYMVIADGYVDDDVIVAGYNAAEYVKAHSLKVTDWALVINSLLDGLSAVGGGALFLPAGEYDCYSDIIVPTGTSLYGEWYSPEQNMKAGGTVLKVHADCGAGDDKGNAFVTMSRDSLIRGLTFWYPEQTDFKNPVKYPATVQLNTSTHAENITLINSYKGIVTVAGGTSIACPNVANIYGTPLSVGLNLDGVGDIMRVENVNFSADYWAQSGLSGAPAGEDLDALKNWLYYNAAGIVLRRIDWSYITCCTVKGYQAGVMFTLSEITTDRYPNGQCLNLLLEDCQTGLFAAGISEFGEMLTSSVIRNCENGIWVGTPLNNPDGKQILYTNSELNVTDVEITATNAAIRIQQKTTLMLMSTTIHSGDVIMEDGWCTMTNNVFGTAAPQVTLDYGALGGSFVGNADQTGAPITIDNYGLCPTVIDDAAAEVPDIPRITPEEAKAVGHKPANASHVVVASLKTDGTDVTADLQAALTAMAKDGGVLYLPAGHYRLNGSVTVPSGVELRGACDIGRLPYNAGTVLDVCAPADGDPSVILEAKSGIRGLVFNYPEQYHNAAFTKDHSFTPYPYAMQGRGADIYVINVALRNGWDGLDLMTYRCDNHYVDYLSGVCFHNELKVGKGAENGIIRNYQFNYITVLQESLYGWNSLPMEQSAFEDIMQAQFNNHDDMVVCLVGDVENELLYNNFNYSGYAGLRFVAEETGAASAKVVGHGVDYSTIDIDVLAAEDIRFVNTQLTTFNQIGDTLQYPMYGVHLGADYTGKVDMVSSIVWANCTQQFRVENGTLNLYGMACHPYISSVQVANITGEGVLNMVNAFFKTAVTTLASDGADKVFVNGGVAYVDLADAAEAGRFDNVAVRVEFWDAPTNAQFAEGDILRFTDAFSDSDKISFKGIVGGNATVSFKSGMATLNMGTNTGVGIANANLSLKCGEDALYHLETRLNMAMFHKNGGTRVMLMLYDNDNDSFVPLTFTEDGKVMTDGTQIAEFETDEWYRVALELDFRDGAHKTCRVVLMDDEYNELAESAVLDFPEEFQDERMYLKQVSLNALADTPADEEDAARTIVKCDYMFAAQRAAAGTLGDVNGDEKIDSTDARLILQYYAKKIGESDLNTAVADVNADGKVDSTDARLILQLYAKKISEF